MDILNASHENHMNKIISHDIVIAIPVYNEENYIAECIESVLNQTFTDFRLLIADNNSTDDTSAICRYFEKKDSRVKVVKHNKNFGSLQNFIYCQKMTESKYFMWLGAHDFIHPTFLQKHFDYMEQNPMCSASYSNTQWIDELSNKTRTTNGSDIYLIDRNASPAEKYATCAKNLYECTAVNQFSRRSSILDTSFCKHPSNLDHVILCHMIAYGYFNHIPEELYFRREFQKRTQTNEERLLGHTNTGISMSDVLIEHIHSIYSHKLIHPATRNPLISTLIEIYESRFKCISGRTQCYHELVNSAIQQSPQLF